MKTRLAAVKTRPGARSRDPAALTTDDDDPEGLCSGIVRLTTIFKMADFDLTSQTRDKHVFWQPATPNNTSIGSAFLASSCY